MVCMLKQNQQVVSLQHYSQSVSCTSQHVNSRECPLCCLVAGISFWRPVAPTGYVPLGCVASSCQPDRKACVVVARQAVVPALLSECLMLCTNGNLWCIQNSMGTFEVAAPDTHHPKVCAGAHLQSSASGLLHAATRPGPRPPSLFVLCHERHAH